MSDNLSTLSFNTTQYNKPLFAFDNSFYTLNRRRRAKAIFRRRKRKTSTSNTIITRYGKIPTELYPYYHQQMTCLEGLKALCLASNYSDLFEFVTEGLSCLTFYATQKRIVDFLEEYEAMTQGILDLANDYDQRAGSEEGRAITSDLAASSKKAQFTEEMLKSLGCLPF
jgi:hypothetical protein